ncbi:type II secretion system protein GspL [Pseudoalteromonas phenolica]|uniref:Type II secretion system protein L n=1 Tax=Pseudoalteromonas phenolica TaxID=161398 RepID=A0A0S2K5H4_9GAMM|nr:type II secretion system protein GspL [Pseudoalteromonas phenolica]ALO43579.1 Type II secretion system protein L [Pseudoalteromonas phenolica]MBE0355256.1 general secretion pathway protein L [Pseudoalteromonas phenolica O-BC30]TMO58473.1 type II secretion system protein GspL [Pseudoalteromonas phenolica]
MTEKLLIRIDQSAKQAIHWLVYSTDQQIIASGEYKQLSDLAELTEKAQGRETSILLSASMVQLKTIELPTKWNRKLEQALPFMLEEQLACDVDEVFIAIGEPGTKDDKPTINIALCDRVLLAELFAVLEEHQIFAKHVVPDALLLPELAENELAVVELDGQWLCRLGAWHACVIEPSWGADYLHALAVERISHYSPADALPEVAPKVAKEAEYELPLALLAKNLTNTAFNLRQGIFAAKKSTPQWWKDWQSGLIAASVALFGFVAVQGIQVVKLKGQAEEVRAEAIATYQQAFPNKRVREALLRRQIEGELKAISATKQGGFLDLADKFVSVYSQVKDFQPETLRYDHKRNELRIRVKAKDFQVFGQVKTILEQKGLTVQQGSLNNDGDAVIGEIRLRGDV